MLNYQIHQNSTTSQWVTFVHGAGGNSSIWRKQMEDFGDQFNILLIDLRGHGKSKTSLAKALEKYTFRSVTKDIIDVLDHLKIKKSHFVGISLGTILIRQLAEMSPQYVQSMVLGGAILKMNVKSRMLMRGGVILKSIIPYMVLYRFFAYMILPRKNHKHSRALVVKEARFLCQKEFIRWFGLVSEINSRLKFFRKKDPNISTLYIMGSEDHLFLPAVKQVISNHLNSNLSIIVNCGHVVNVDKPQEFNNKSLVFLKDQLS